MALIINDRVKETSTTTGTGTFDLAGAATGFETFVAGIGDTNTTYYCIFNQGTTEFEVGIGTVTDAATDTLSRDTVISSSNSDSKVNFSSGTKDVFCTLPASKAVVKDASDNVNGNLNFGDSDKAQFGDSQDLQISHDGTHSYIHDSGTGDLRLRGSVLSLRSENDNVPFVTASATGVTLTYGGATKFQTINTGVQTTGTVNVNGAYTLPTSDGSANQILETDGSGAVTFVDKPSSGVSAGFAVAMAIAL